MSEAIIITRNKLWDFRHGQKSANSKAAIRSRRQTMEAKEDNDDIFRCPGCGAPMQEGKRMRPQWVRHFWCGWNCFTGRRDSIR